MVEVPFRLEAEAVVRPGPAVQEGHLLILRRVRVLCFCGEGPAAEVLAARPEEAVAHLPRSCQAPVP